MHFLDFVKWLMKMSKTIKKSVEMLEMIHMLFQKKQQYQDTSCSNQYNGHAHREFTAAGFMVEGMDADEDAQTPADYCNKKKGGLRNAVSMPDSPFLIYAHNNETNQINQSDIDHEADYR